MPPKVKTTKAAIVSAAIELVRKEGEQAINARAIAAVIGCSTQPIFSNFSTMDELRSAISAEAEKIYNKYTENEIEEGKYPPYKATGMAYIRFASEEKELFKLLYMSRRNKEEIQKGSRIFDDSVQFVRNYTGLDTESAALFHLELWAFVHGIASMHATGFLSLDEDLISQMLTDTYLGLKKQHSTE